jgi:hypothetical protein
LTNRASIRWAAVEYALKFSRKRDSKTSREVAVARHDHAAFNDDLATALGTKTVTQIQYLDFGDAGIVSKGVRPMRLEGFKAALAKRIIR